MKYYSAAAEKWKEAYVKECQEYEELQLYLENLWDPFQGMSQFRATGGGDAGAVGATRASAKSDLGTFDRRVYTTVTKVTSKFSN